MLAKPLGATSVLLPEVGLGTWDYSGGAAPLQAGIEAGARFIDTAESYGSEPVVAEAVAGRRSEVFLATKVSPHHFRRADLFQALDESLRRLRTDHVDLYQLHRPNPAVPLAETLGAMEDAVDAGKVRFIGVSNFSVAQLEETRRLLRRHPLVANQVRYNLIDRTIEPDLLPFCAAHKITVIAYSPLSRGLTHLLDCDEQGVLRRLAAETGRTVAQVALNWCLGRPGVVVIPKGSSVAHARENCGASGWRLTAGQQQLLAIGVRSRRRTELESFLRQHLPPGMKRTIQRLARLAPRRLRRNIQ